MGSTGYQPVPVGNLPTGREETLCRPKPRRTPATSPPFRRASGPAARAGSPCYPFRYEISGLGQERADHSAAHVRQAEIAALKPIRQSRVFEPEEMENRGVKIVDVNRITNNVPPDFIRL